MSISGINLATKALRIRSAAMRPPDLLLLLCCLCRPMTEGASLPLNFLTRFMKGSNAGVEHQEQHLPDDRGAMHLVIHRTLEDPINFKGQMKSLTEML